MSTGRKQNGHASRGIGDVSLPVLSSGKGAQPPIRKSKNARRRAVVLILLHVAMGAHIVQWLMTGSTISPIEPSESMETLETGRINAGFIFFGVALIATLVFGRFVCGWGCHIVALQDLCGWIMKRCGVRPKPFRTRLLLLAPLALALYMFVWPTFRNYLLVPGLDAIDPAIAATLGLVSHKHSGFTLHLVTEDFWDTFPTIAVAIPFLLICGFGAVYLLGAKGFCTYGCPYGGFFAPLDKLSPGRIVVDHDRCDGSGHCTATCTSNVRVHEEIREYGMVVDPGCMKCMDCISVCPNDALSFAFTKPAVAKGRPRNEAPRRKFDTTLREEVLLGVAALACFAAIRGAYGAVPLLMTMGVAACATFLGWKVWRTFTTPNVRLVRFQLRLRGRTLPAGWTVIAATGVLWLLIAHTGVVNYQRWQGNRHFDQVGLSLSALLSAQPVEVTGAQRDHARAALAHYERAMSFARGGWGLADHPKMLLDAAQMYLVTGEPERTLTILETVFEDHASTDRIAADIARVHLKAGDPEGALAHMEEALAGEPLFWETRQEYVNMLLAQGQPDKAIAECRSALGAIEARTQRERTALARTELALARAMEAARRPDEAIAHYRAAAEARPDQAIFHESLASGLARIKGDVEGAASALEEALRLEPDNFRAWFYLGQMRLALGRDDAAVEALEHAVEHAPAGQRAGVARDIGLMLVQQGQPDAGERFLERSRSEG